MAFLGLTASHGHPIKAYGGYAPKDMSIKLKYPIGLYLIEIAQFVRCKNVQRAGIKEVSRSIIFKIGAMSMVKIF
jgi:hypothetical protein